MLMGSSQLTARGTARHSGLEKPRWISDTGSAATARGMKEDSMRELAGFMTAALERPMQPRELARLAEAVAAFCAAFPTPGVPRM